MRTELTTVTPEMANAWLERNTHNRPMKASVVRYFETQLRSGRAGTTHQGIAIDIDGNLQDGQHRLQGIINTGVPWEMWVTYDCPVDNFHLIDVGSKRTVGELLSIRGYKSHNHLAALGHFAWQWELGRAAFSGQATDDQLVALFERYPSILDAEQVRIKGLGVTPAALSFMCYLAASPEFVGDLTSDTPDEETAGGRLALTYRTKVERKQKLPKKDQIAVFVKARNDHPVGLVSTKRVYQFREAEAFPVPVWGPPIPFDARHVAGDREADEDE